MVAVSLKKFFFKQKTAYEMLSGDWSSDVCSSDLGGRFGSILDMGHNPSGHFRGMKSDSWEGGHRIPFLLRWPGTIPEGIVTDALTCDLDLYATLADISGATLPEGAAVDSRSLLPLLESTPFPDCATAVVRTGCRPSNRGSSDRLSTAAPSGSVAPDMSASVA